MNKSPFTSPTLRAKGGWGRSKTIQIWTRKKGLGRTMSANRSMLPLFPSNRGFHPLHGLPSVSKSDLRNPWTGHRHHRQSHTVSILPVPNSDMPMSCRKRTTTTTMIGFGRWPTRFGPHSRAVYQHGKRGKSLVCVIAHVHRIKYTCSECDLFTHWRDTRWWWLSPVVLHWSPDWWE